MQFTSISFLFHFLPIFLVLYYIADARFKNGILLLGSVAVFEGYESGLINISMEDGIGILMFSMGFSLSILGATVLYLRGVGDKFLAKKANRRMKKQNISGE